VGAIFGFIDSIIGKLGGLIDLAGRAARAVTGALSSGGGGGLWNNIPGRAHGGPVAAGRAYVVGERGPELFVPNMAGRIEASSRLAPASSGTGGGNVYIELTVQGNLIHERELEDVVARAAQAWSTRNGPMFARTAFAAA